jgi:hypothetical protein
VQNRQNLDRGLISQKSRDLFAKFPNNLNNELFSTVNPVYWVHVSVDRPGVLGPPLTDAGADRGHNGALIGAWPPAAPVRQSLPAGAQNGEGSEGNSARVSLELGRCCGGRVTVVQNGEVAALGERKARVWREAKRSWERCGELWGWCLPFIGGRGSTGEGWLGVNRRC